MFALNHMGTGFFSVVLICFCFFGLFFPSKALRQKLMMLNDIGPSKEIF